MFGLLGGGKVAVAILCVEDAWTAVLFHEMGVVPIGGVWFRKGVNLGRLHVRVARYLLFSLCHTETGIPKFSTCVNVEGVMVGVSAGPGHILTGLPGKTQERVLTGPTQAHAQTNGSWSTTARRWTGEVDGGRTDGWEASPSRLRSGYPGPAGISPGGIGGGQRSLGTGLSRVPNRRRWHWNNSNYILQGEQDPWGFARSEPGPGIAGLDRVLAVKGPRQEINGKIVGLSVLDIHLPPKTARQVGEVSCAGGEKGRKRRSEVGWLSPIRRRKKTQPSIKVGLAGVTRDEK